VSTASYYDVVAGGKRAERAAWTYSEPARRFEVIRDAVAFYPNCTRNYPGGPAFRPYAPLYVLMGALDDWTPAAPCMALVERAKAAGAPIAIKVYPGAHHSFDAPATPLRYRPEVRNHSKPGGCCGATVGTDPAARADAIAEVTGFLAARVAAPRH